MTQSSRGLVTGFFVAFGLTLGSFVGAAVFVRTKARAIGSAAESIVLNASPSIERLSSMQSQLRRLEVNLDDALDRAETQGAVEPLDALVWTDEVRLMAQWGAYAFLPPYPGEQGFTVGLSLSLRELSRTMARYSGLLQSGDLVTARGVLEEELKPGFEHLDGLLTAAMQVNASAAGHLAEVVVHSRERVRSIAVLLDGVCIALSLLAALFALRLARAYARAMEERVSELETFAARVAHDLKNPLASVAMAVSLATQGRVSESRAQALLERAGRSLRRVANLVDDLLLFARAPQMTQKGAQADVASALIQVMDENQPSAIERNIELRLETPEPCAVACSDSLLCDLVSNLVTNAIKYMGESPIRRVLLRARPEPTRVRIEVEDTGPGIPRDRLKSIFQPYVRATNAQVPGLGLGLATVERLAGALGGAVGVHAVEGEGSLFWVELPASVNAPSAAHTRAG